MRDNGVKKIYAMPCKHVANYSLDFISPASSLPGSANLRYIPLDPSLHKYAVKSNCAKLFTPSVIWKGTPVITEVYNNLLRNLRSLPIILPLTVCYMKQTEGYFFDIKLKDDVRLTVTRYMDNSDDELYINVMHKDDVAFQGIMAIEDLLTSINEYYDGSEE